MDKVIYFPYINVPKNRWFAHVLLYWNEVGSIVPYGYINNPEKLRPHMREFVKAGLVKQVIPGRYVRCIPQFKEAFLELINNHEIIKERISRKLNTLRTIRIHMEKLDDLADDLCDMGLADQRVYPWFVGKDGAK